MIWIRLIEAALTVGSVRFRSAQWLRLMTAILCLLHGAISILGLTTVARSGMIDDLALLRSQTAYGEAFRNGLLVAQKVVNYTLWDFVVSFACLGILALLPIRSKKT
jgi:hypothetical protein